jgi:hypothetical protein
MKTKTMYICENCGEEFEKRHDCENHEFKCCDKRVKYEENIKNVIIRAKQEFGSLIADAKYVIEDDSFVCADDDFHYCYHFRIDFKLSNGNSVVINDGMDEDLWLGNYLEEDIIYKSTKREIEKCIPTSFEGIIRWDYDDGWRTDYLGELTISDIVDRLHGRKVRIEVIEEQ